MEADFMQAVAEVPVRKPVKEPTFGALIREFSELDEVKKSKRDFLTAQACSSREEMRLAHIAYMSIMESSTYYEEVLADVRILVKEIQTRTKYGNHRWSISAMTSTRLDFSMQACWFVSCPKRGQDATDKETIQSMAMSTAPGGYQLAYLESLYRGRGESMEEGVGTFIIPLLGLKRSKPAIWMSCKQTECRWIFEICRQGLAMSINLFPTDLLETGIIETFVQLHREDAVVFSLMHVELLEHEEAMSQEIVQAILDIHRRTGLMFAKDDVDAETLSDPLKRRKLIELFTALKGILTTLKLDSSIMRGAMNVPLVP
jgi:hypothetical protein